MSCTRGWLRELIKTLTLRGAAKVAALGSLEELPVVGLLFRKVHLALYDTFAEAVTVTKGAYKGTAFFAGLDAMTSHGALSRAGLSEDGDYEPEVRSAIEAFCHRGMVVFDVGANVGLHTVTMAKRVGVQGRVYAFEPNPFAARLLTLTCRANSLVNVKVIGVAIGDRVGKARLLYSSPHDTEACIENDGAYYVGGNPPRLKAVLVGVTTLDSFVQQNRISQLDFVKADVQGAELKLLAGMRRSLHNLRPVVVCEFVGSHSLNAAMRVLSAAHYRAQELTKKFFPCGYAALRTDKANFESAEFWVDVLAVPLRWETPGRAC
jgi:FkbM family methyltransferase